MSRALYPFYKQVFLDENAESFYLLGAYFADGNITTKKHGKSFSICAQDESWILDIRSRICPTKPVYKNNNCHILDCSNQEVLDWFVSYGCVPNKSKTAKLEKSIPKEYQSHFLRGLFDRRWFC
jgi:hypothetical protein